MFQTIVFAYDGSAECRDAFAEGIELASRFQARCYLLAVFRPQPEISFVEGPVSEEVLEQDRAELIVTLKGAIARMRQAGIDAASYIQIDEEPAKAIAAFAAEKGADLIIIGHHPHPALSRWWHDSVGHSLLDHVPCSVFVSMPKRS